MPNNAAAAPLPPQIVFCPGCVVKMRAPADLPPGRKLKCPKCKQAFDPSLASSRGSGRLKVQQGLASETAGLPEWATALLLGLGCGALFGGINGLVIGAMNGSFDELSGGSIWGGLIGYTLLGVLFFGVVGGLIGLAIAVGGGPVAGYVVAGVSLIPALFLFGPWFGPGAAILIGYLISTVIDYKLYS